MTNRFNKHDFIENQAKLDFFWQICDNFFDMLEHSLINTFILLSEYQQNIFNNLKPNH